MDNNLTKKLGAILSQIPKKDLNKNIEQAKKILNSSKKEDLEKLLNSSEASRLLGENKKDLTTNINALSEQINVEELKKAFENLQ